PVGTGDGQRLDLDRIWAGELDAEGRTGRKMVREVGAVDPVEGFEVGDLGEEDRHLDHPIERTAGGREDRSDIVENPPGLRLDPAADESAGRRVVRDLS